LQYNYSLFFNIQISTTYEKIILEVAVLSIALAKPDVACQLVIIQWMESCIPKEEEEVREITLIIKCIKTYNFKIRFGMRKSRGGYRGGGTRRAPPLKLEKIRFFGPKIVIFHTKYPKNFRASLRSAQFF
jgi:hypothetical protein